MVSNEKTDSNILYFKFVLVHSIRRLLRSERMERVSCGLTHGKAALLVSKAVNVSKAHTCLLAADTQCRNPSTASKKTVPTSNQGAIHTSLKQTVTLIVIIIS